VSVVVPELLTAAGLNAEYAPDGNPVKLKRIVAISEPTGLMLTVYDVVDPRTTLWEVGTTEIEKSDTARATSVT